MFRHKSNKSLVIERHGNVARKLDDVSTTVRIFSEGRFGRRAEDVAFGPTSRTHQSNERCETVVAEGQTRLNRPVQLAVK